MKKCTVHLGSAHITARPAPLVVLACDRRNRGGGIPFDAGGLLAKSDRPTAIGRWGSGLGVTPVDGDPDLRRRAAGGSPWQARGGDGGRVEGCASEGGPPVVVGSVGDVDEHLRAQAMLLVGLTGLEEHQRRRSTGRRPRQQRRRSARCYNSPCRGQWRGGARRRGAVASAWSGGGQ
jgi:hypothetical protein